MLSLSIDFETHETARPRVAATSPRSWYLEVEGRRVELREGETTLGRSRGSGVVLRDPSVSRGHALLSVNGEQVTIQDLRSSNGTYVNGSRVQSETAVAEGDRLTIGETQAFLRRAGRPGEPERLRRQGSDAALFCPGCGQPVPDAAADCPACGGPLAGVRLPRRSEALAMGEILPVGEVLGSFSESWDATEPRRAFRHVPGEETPNEKPPSAALQPPGSGEMPQSAETGVAAALLPSRADIDRLLDPAEPRAPHPPGFLSRIASRLFRRDPR